MKKLKIKDQHVCQWLDAILSNIKDIIDNINKLSDDNKLTESEFQIQMDKLKNQYALFNLIKDIKEGRTILQGFNFKMINK